jgi:hypothetical protein
MYALPFCTLATQLFYGGTHANGELLVVVFHSKAVSVTLSPARPQPYALML